jgi:hypothetical protein
MKKLKLLKYIFDMKVVQKVTIPLSFHLFLGEFKIYAKYFWKEKKKLMANMKFSLQNQ